MIALPRRPETPRQRNRRHPRGGCSRDAFGQTEDGQDWLYRVRALVNGEIVTTSSPPRFPFESGEIRRQFLFLKL